MKRILIVLITFTMIGVSGLLTAQDVLKFSSPQGKFIPLVTFKILQEAYNKLGIKVKSVSLPGERALIVANAGEVDGVLNRIAGFKKYSQNLIRIDVPVYQMEIDAFSTNLIFEVKGWQSLLPYRLLIRRGVRAVETQLLSGMSYQKVSTAKQLFLMLNAGRADLVIYPRSESILTIKELGLQNINILTPPITTVNLYHYLHKKHEYLVPRITKLLHKMEKEGQIQKIRNQVYNELF